MSSKYEIKMILFKNTIRSIPFEIANIITSYITKGDIGNKKINENDEVYLSRSHFKPRHKHLMLFDFTI